MVYLGILQNVIKLKIIVLKHFFKPFMCLLEKMKLIVYSLWPSECRTRTIAADDSISSDGQT